MIEKMKFLSISGPKDDIDRVVDQYLSRYEIHLENALSELKTVSGSSSLYGKQPLPYRVPACGRACGAILNRLHS